MIAIGLVAGLVLCTPLFIYLQRTGPETGEGATGLADTRTATPPRQTTLESERKQETAAVEKVRSPHQEAIPAEESKPARAHGQFDPTYCPRPGDIAEIGYPQLLATGPLQIRVVFYPVTCFESLESLTPFMKPHEFDGHVDRAPTIQLSQAKRYLVQAGTEAKIIDKAGVLYDLVQGQERRIPIYKVEIMGGLLRGRQLFCTGLDLQQEAQGRAEPWSVEDSRIYSVLALEADNPEYVLEQYKGLYVVDTGRHLSFLTSRLQAHHMEPPTTKREAFLQSLRTNPPEPIANRSEAESTPEPDRRPRRDEGKKRDEPDATGLTIALLEKNGGHTKYLGMVPIYQVTALIRNTSSRPLKWLKMIVVFRDADDRLISTENQYADVRTIEPEATSTVKVMTRENLDTIDHYDLRFEADGRNVEYLMPKSR
jgi:hypothetical protein